MTGEFEDEFSPGKVLLQKYRVERTLGRGAMGIVVAARHLELEELFAIKLMSPQIAYSPNGPPRFLREARATARLTSQHVARVTDVGRLDNGLYYLVMEYLSGENLYQRLASRGPFPATEVANLMLQACEAIAEAHAKGIVHRDIKLSNLFLDERQLGRPCLKVIDFGVSKYRDLAEQLTVPGAVLGSPETMSPEQFSDSNNIDGRSDVWALGVVMYQLLTGCAPFAAQTFPALMRAVLRDTPRSPSQLRSDVSPQWDRLILRCLEKHVEDRYPSVEALAADIRSSSFRPPSGKPAPPKTTVFLSYRTDEAMDREFATDVWHSLAEAEISVLTRPQQKDQAAEWTLEVSKCLSACDFVVVLLTRRALVSEMVRAELEMARRLSAAQGREKPLIVPVLVGISAPNAEQLGELIHDAEPVPWNGAADMEVLLRRLRRSRAEDLPPPSQTLAVDSPPHLSSSSSELPGAIVSPRSSFYVAPQIESACRREILAPAALIRIKGPRQTGKTSLMMGLLNHAARSGARTVVINLEMAESARLNNLDALLKWLCAVVTRKLRLSQTQTPSSWDDVFGVKDNCTAYFEDTVLSSGDALVLAFDHVDRLFDCPGTGEEFLSLLRAWHEMGKSGPPWNSLRMVLAYSTEVYLPLQTNHSPFNVGFPAVLTEWNSEIVFDLTIRHGLAWEMKDVERLMSLIGGHPHLIRIALYESSRGTALESILKTGATDEGPFSDHLKCLLWQLQSQPELNAAAATVIASPTPIRVATDIAFKLVSLGLVQLQGDAVRPARELYRKYLTGRLKPQEASRD